MIQVWVHISIEIHYFIQIELFFELNFSLILRARLMNKMTSKDKLPILKSSKSVESMEEITMLSGNLHDFFFFYFVSLFAIFFFSFSFFHQFSEWKNWTNLIKKTNGIFLKTLATIFSGKKSAITISYQIFSIREQMKLNKNTRNC